MCWPGVIVKLDWLDFSNPLPDIHLGHTDAVVVLTTLATTDEAARFVRALLDRRLVACGTILPGTRSLYRWEDKLADETEVVVMLKTRSGAIHGLEKAFKELHPYKVPELLTIPVSGGLERYLGWINDETSLTIV
jgi:periplasmic divalent cation tolerance protein